MARQTRPGAAYRSPEWRARVSRGLRRFHERRRREAQLRPRDLDRLRNSGSVIQALRPLLDLADTEAGELMEALGGLDRVSPQRRQLIEDTVAIGVALRGTLAAYLQTGDSELASRVATLAGARRANLVALGLERLERDAMTLEQYTAMRDAQAARHGPNGGSPDPEAEDVENAPQRAVESANQEDNQCPK